MSMLQLILRRYKCRNRVDKCRLSVVQQCHWLRREHTSSYDLFKERKTRKKNREGRTETEQANTTVPRKLLIAKGIIDKFTCLGLAIASLPDHNNSPNLTSWFGRLS
jgi:hypothetical protein